MYYLCYLLLVFFKRFYVLQFDIHTFTNTHPNSEDLCCILSKSKILNHDGTHLSLNQATSQ